MKEREYVSVEWLASHHYSKSSNRFHQVSKLPVFEGQSVLDLGCGPGFYMRYFSDMVGPQGKVVGVDKNPVTLDFAERYLSAFPFKNWELTKGDIELYDQDLESFDIVVLINAIGFFSNPTEFLQRLIDRMKRGARLIVKDFDMASIFVHPMDKGKMAELISAAEIRNGTKNPLNFDNFFGRKVFNLHKKLKNVDHSNSLWAQGMVSPFNEYEKTYIRGNIESMMTQAEATASDETMAYFEEMFFSGGLFFDDADALFTESEYVTILTVC